ncbi:malate synthase A [Idiomarina sp. WRN-38]|uniref:malate synthase A n=1 Tax=Idiomarina sp. OXR-189 TaxID=3100175 RepID=UPI00073348E9|nr:malate synthase A [Idiomarina sp. OXR-189]KTG28641.1 malate synthase A [Idiomarina sp. H105]OAF08512.1 malate synthase A [Idiomarina sp. WRN-38]WPZ00777.1 malate synthase A [Idiomarina sp. OXR-189]
MNNLFQFSQPLDDKAKVLFSDEHQEFLAELIDTFQPRLNELLEKRQQRQANYDSGALPDFDPNTQDIRESNWKIAPLPKDLQKRRLEITGPVDRKMVINALNANVDCYMADFEDSQSPTWDGMVNGQINLRDANLGGMTYTDPSSGKHYKVGENPALLIARVRGLHLPEKHVQRNGQAIPGALMDFALYFLLNYQQRLQKGTGVYYYLPKLEHSAEAKWWADVFHFTEQKFNLKTSTIRATVLIETLPAVFQMHEILYALKDHIAALNCGRWDYIFSYIKTLKAHADRVLPDRQVVSMDKPFLNAYSRLLVKTCHQRGALAMGGMAAFIPSKDPAENEKILAKVHADKTLERDNGHDGTWIAHPGLADTVREIFVDGIKGDNQLHVLREEDSDIDQSLLLQPCDGERTEAGMRTNIRVSLQYIAAWLNGKGCVPIYGLMEDAATAEISRTSIWQWIRHGKKLSDGTPVTKALFTQLLQEEAEVVKNEVGKERWSNEPFEQALALLENITTADELVDFLTLPGYEQLN